MLHSRVIKVEDHDILRAYADELIHHIGHVGPFYHRADCNPFRVFERRDRRRTPSGCDRGRRGKLRAKDVVLTHYVLARRNHARDACCDLVHKWRQVRMLRRRGTDQYCFRLKQRRDGSQACGAHRLAGLYIKKEGESRNVNIFIFIHSPTRSTVEIDSEFFWEIGILPRRWGVTRCTHRWHLRDRVRRPLRRCRRRIRSKYARPSQQRARRARRYP